MQRVALPLVSLAVLALAVWWLWTTRQTAESAPVAATPTEAVEPTEVRAEPAGPPPGFRLAGLAVGEPASFAAIELPDGRSRLYRLNSDVPGLGTIVEITEAGIVVEGENGRFSLQLKPAATATPDRRRVNGEDSDEATTAPERPGDRDDKALEPAA